MLGEPSNEPPKSTWVEETSQNLLVNSVQKSQPRQGPGHQHSELASPAASPLPAFSVCTVCLVCKFTFFQRRRAYLPIYLPCSNALDEAGKGFPRSMQILIAMVDVGGHDSPVSVPTQGFRRQAATVRHEPWHTVPSPLLLPLPSPRKSYFRRQSLQKHAKVSCLRDPSVES